MSGVTLFTDGFSRIVLSKCSIIEHLLKTILGNLTVFVQRSNDNFESVKKNIVGFDGSNDCKSARHPSHPTSDLAD